MANENSNPTANTYLYVEAVLSWCLVALGKGTGPMDVTILAVTALKDRYRSHWVSLFSKKPNLLTEDPNLCRYLLHHAERIGQEAAGIARAHGLAVIHEDTALAAAERVEGEGKRILERLNKSLTDEARVTRAMFCL